MFNKSLKFLQLLQQNNNRDWFHANKSIYNEAKAEFELVTEILIHEVSRFDKDIAGLQPKDCIFRIFRDIRFSSDKTPYKTNFGTYLVHGGRNSGFAGYYFHLDIKGSFLAGGIYMPPSEILKAVRNEIYEHPEEFKNILSEAKRHNEFNVLHDEKLKTAPKGFPRDFPDIELLKYKSYGLSRIITDSELSSDKILNTIIENFKIIKPMICFINNAIESKMN
ncbi:MAG: DUF2461 domain-containing protein [Bacteroidales bacterium]|nr:DUF2461 domain-containing protein [Bacteroidales bacterium]